MRNLNFKQKIFYGFILFSILIVSLSSIVLFEINKNTTIEEILDRSEMEFKERQLFLTTSLNQYSDFVLSFTGSTSFLSNVKTNNYEVLENIFMARIKSHAHIIQIRYIDINGQEKVRIDRKSLLSEVISNNKLQNKSERYYFKEIMNTKKGTSWYSKIDLNKENGKVEKPIKPVIRIGTPVYIDNVKKGILIVNVSMKSILNYLSNSIQYNIYLIDSDGYFILHKPNDYDENDYSFSRYLNLNHRVESHFKKDYENILNNDIYEGENFYSRVINQYYNERLKIILEIKYNMTQSIFDKFKEDLFFVLFISVLLSVPFAYIVSQIIEEERRDLEDILESEKDKLKDNELKLEKQSKLAHMGEMVGNIAHQWRQPLQSIAGTAGSMKVQSEFGLLEPSELQEGMEQIEERTKYLSEVIDVFRNFVNEDKILEAVVVQERIEHALDVVSLDIETKQIKIIQDINYKDEILIRLTKGELVQVIVNIMYNAKDVLVERDIKNAWIKISLEYTDENVIILIEDNAGGIQEDILPKIFDPYFTTKHQSQGTGLGLHMSHDIVVNSLNGDLTVQNTSEGAKFIITIPLWNEMDIIYNG